MSHPTLLDRANGPCFCQLTVMELDYVLWSYGNEASFVPKKAPLSELLD